jgi:hypothetical protein
LSTYGDTEQGFRIESRGDAVLVTAWGFWSVGFVPEFLPAVLAALEAKGRGVALAMDLKDLRPLRDEGQQAFRALLGRALAHGVVGVELKGASALTRLQMLRLTRELGAQDRIRVT